MNLRIIGPMLTGFSLAQMIIHFNDNWFMIAGFGFILGLGSWLSSK